MLRFDDITFIKTDDSSSLAYQVMLDNQYQTVYIYIEFFGQIGIAEVRKAKELLNMATQQGKYIVPIQNFTEVNHKLEEGKITIGLLKEGLFADLISSMRKINYIYAIDPHDMFNTSRLLKVFDMVGLHSQITEHIQYFDDMQKLYQKLDTTEIGEQLKPLKL